MKDLKDLGKLVFDEWAVWKAAVFKLSLNIRSNWRDCHNTHSRATLLEFLIQQFLGGPGNLCLISSQVKLLYLGLVTGFEDH